MKFFSLFFIFFFYIGVSFAQNQMAIYICDQWLDVKKKGLAMAMKNPNYENVEIIKTNKNFKVTLGRNIYNYQILSASRFSELQMRYKVRYLNKNYTMCVSECFDSPGIFIININKEWATGRISNVSYTLGE